MRVIFMGSPAFAVPALKALIDASYEVVAVYTQPPRPSGRGHEVRPTPIHQLAEQHHIPVETVENFKDQAAIKHFASYKPDVAVVCAYGLIVPKGILEACPHGCINIHPSALPRWRGAAPLQHTILAGDTETAMSIMQMDIGMDTGPIIRMHPLKLPERITITELHDMMARIGAEELLLVLDQLEKQGEIISIPQSEEGVTYTTKIKKEMGRLHWREPAEVIDCKIRALTPWPGVFFEHKGERIKILKAEYDDELDSTHSPECGTILSLTPLTIQCGEGVLYPKILQREGKNPMDVEAFLRGYSLKKGVRF